MAVTAPVAGTASQSNGAAVAPTRAASIAANDIEFVWAVFYDSALAAPSSITWPAGFTEGMALQTKNASGTAIGIGGWAWRRAAGGETGTLSITAGLTGNATTGGSFGNAYKVSGCVTSGDPFEDSQGSAPNYTTSVTWPSATMARSAGGASVLIETNTDNINIATPTNWTALTSNGGTQGSDSGGDVDYRIPAATGTYSPAGVTMGASNGFGWATFQIIFTDTALAATVLPPPQLVVQQAVNRSYLW